MRDHADRHFVHVQTDKNGSSLGVKAPRTRQETCDGLTGRLVLRFSSTRTGSTRAEHFHR